MFQLIGRKERECVSWKGGSGKNQEDSLLQPFIWCFFYFLPIMYSIFLFLSAISSFLSLLLISQGYQLPPPRHQLVYTHLSTLSKSHTHWLSILHDLCPCVLLFLDQLLWFFFSPFQFSAYVDSLLNIFSSLVFCPLVYI